MHVTDLILSPRGLLTLAFVGTITLLVALTTEIGPIVAVLSHAHGIGVHVGDLVAMAMAAMLATAVNLTSLPVLQGRGRVLATA